MTNQTIEFSIGDPVTYYPYEHAYTATVTGIRAHRDRLGRPDDRVFYFLTGRGDPRVETETTGISISESQYFEPCQDKPEFKTKHPLAVGSNR